MLPDRGKSMSKGRNDGLMFATLINQMSKDAINQEKEYKRRKYGACRSPVHVPYIIVTIAVIFIVIEPYFPNSFPSHINGLIKKPYCPFYMDPIVYCLPNM